MSKDDERLVISLQAGESGAFEQLVDNYSKIIYSTAFSMLQNEQDAQDAAQDVAQDVAQDAVKDVAQDAAKGDAQDVASHERE